jgi:hypothetical protein
MHVNEIILETNRRGEIVRRLGLALLTAVLAPTAAAARGFACEEGEFAAHIGACIKARRETGQCAKDFA